MRIDTFMKRAAGKVDPKLFISEHRDFLCEFNSVRPVIAMFEAGALFPTQALHQILLLIATEKDPLERVEVVNKKTGEFQEKTIKAIEKAVKKTELKKYQLFLFVKDEFGGVTVEDVFTAPDYGQAMRDSYRILFKNEASVYMDISGMGVTTRITRNQAVGETLGPRIGGKMATKKTSGSTSSVGWRPTAKQFVAKFSRG